MAPANLNTYQYGNLIRVSAAFTSFSTGMPLDPDVVKLAVRVGIGQITTYTFGTGGEIVKDSTGNYHADLDVETSGQWYYRWFSTGNGQASLEQSFLVSEVKTAA